MENASLSRRDFIKGCAAGASVLLYPDFLQERVFAGEQKRPNIVLFVSDDHGLDGLGCYGNRVVKTPNLDTLAAQGTRFTNTFCTTASCSASRSVILTGLYNHANGQYGHEHEFHHFISLSSVKSLPVLLAQLGYRTARIGKLHVAPEEVYKFDIALPCPPDMRNGVEMADNAKAFINAQDNKPFFLYFCPADPHRGEGTFEQGSYKIDRFGNRPQGYKGIKTVTYKPGDVIVPSFLPDTSPCRAEIAQHYQAVSRLDQGVARLVQVLEESGKYDNTIFIYVSDNGIAFPGAKTTLYESGTHLPCIVRTPWQKNRGITCDALINWADLTPTILDFAGAVPAKTEFHGRSFKSVLEQEHPQGWDETYASHTFHEITMYYPMRAVRQRKYKLIWNIAYPLEYPQATDLWASAAWQAQLKRGDKYFGKRSIEAYLHRRQFELYDLEKDPDEINNLAYMPEYEQTLTELKAKIKAFQQRTKDPWISKQEHE